MKDEHREAAIKLFTAHYHKNRSHFQDVTFYEMLSSFMKGLDAGYETAVKEFVDQADERFGAFLKACKEAKESAAIGSGRLRLNGETNVEDS